MRGVLRRGLKVEALRNFIVSQGSSRSVVFMEWDKIWAMNKKVLDPIAPRYTTVDRTYNVVVSVEGQADEESKADLHPKDPSVGQKTVWRSGRVLIDGVDAEQLVEGTNATFINWGNLTIKKVNKDQSGKVVGVEAKPDLENRDFKKTLKVTWLADTAKAPLTPAVCVYYDHIVSKPVLDKDDDFKDFVGKDTKTTIDFLGDPELRKLKKGDSVQIQRRGFFVVDSPYAPPCPNTCKPNPIRLIAIPDGTPGSYGPPGKANKKEAAPTPANAKAGKAGAKKNQQQKQQQQPKAAAAPQAAAASGDAAKLYAEVEAQGNQVRKLKAEKATKEAVQAEVQVLLDLKAKYKEATGKEWKPGQAPAPSAAAAGSNGEPAASSSDSSELGDKISAQGDLVRKLKAEKAEKAKVTAEVEVLLALKKEFKEKTGQEWKPGQQQPKQPQQQSGGKKGGKGKSPSPAPASPAAAAPASPAAPVPVAAGPSRDDVLRNIAAQGDKVRQLKASKADKGAIAAEVNMLLALKAQYENVTGEKWKPGLEPSSPAPAAAAPSPAPSAGSSSSSGGNDDLKKDLSDRISAQGDIVRKLKASKADAADVDANVQILLGLKEKYKEKTGEDWKPPGGGGGGGGGGRKKDKKKKQVA